MQRLHRAALGGRAAVAALGAVAVLACSRPRPSPEYERASGLWTDVVRSRPDDPAGDARADEVLALLARVPRESVDAAAASALRDRIEAERRQAAEERARRERLVAMAAAPAAPLSNDAAMRGPGVASPAPAAPAPSGPAITPGMKVDAFRDAFGTCFASAGPVQVESPGAAPRAGEMWVMKDEPSCREAQARLVGQAVLFVGGTFAGFSPVGAVKQVEVRREVELGVLPDGGPGMVVDGKVVPLPPGSRLVPAPPPSAPPRQREEEP